MSRLICSVSSLLLMCFCLALHPLATSAVITQSIDFENEIDGDPLATIGLATFDAFITATAGASLNEFEVPPRSGLNVAMNTDATATVNFLVGVTQVNGYLTYTTSMSVIAYGSHGIIATFTSAFASNLALSGDPLSSPNETFLFTSNDPITSLVFKSSSNGVFALDDFSFSVDTTSPPSQIPEPGSSSLLMLGILLLATRMRKQRWTRAKSAISFGVLAWAGVANAQAPLRDLTVFPQNVRPGTPVQVTVILSIPDTNYIPGSAVLNRVDERDKIIKRVATFVDDGTNGDEMAGDKQFTARFTVNEATAQPYFIAASIAYKGMATRTNSPSAIVWVSPDADPSAGNAMVQGDKVLFKNSAGSTVSSITLASYDTTNVNLPTGPAVETRVDSAFVSESQQRAGIITSRWINTASALEGSAIPSLFRYYTADGRLLFSTNSNPERSYLADAKLEYASRSGSRLILVEVDEDNTNPSIQYLDDTGKILAEYSTLPDIASVLEAKITSNGRYIAVIGTGSQGSIPQTVVVVIDTDSNGIYRVVFNSETTPSVMVEENLMGSFAIINGETIVEQLP